MAQTLTLDRQPDADTADTLIENISDPAVSRAAQHLIVRHRQGQRFEIEALDVPHAAFAEISEQLEEAGISHALSDTLLSALRRYIVSTGGSFSRAANAKPVRIHMVVTDRMPKSRFDNAMTELACLGPQEIRVEGATRVNVRATPSGTATSSNAADIDAMYMNIRGLYLWVRFEAPTKEDLDGLMTNIEATLAGVAQSVGGSMGAADFKKLLETLQKDGMMTPAVTALVNKLIALQGAAGKDGKITLPAPELAVLLKDIGALMDKSQGLIPPALAQAVMQSMADMAMANPAIASFISERGFASMMADNDNVSVQERLDAVMEKIAQLTTLDGLDPKLAAELSEMLAKAQADLKAGEVTPAALLQTLGEGLSSIAAREGVPQTLADGIKSVLPEIDALRESTQLNGAVTDLAQGAALLAVIEDIAAQVQKGEIDLKNLPPEIQALIEKMGGVETLLSKEGREARVQQLAEAIEAKGDADLSMAVHAAVIAMANPDTLATLPPATATLVETFVADNPAIVETAMTHTVLRDMTAALAGVDPASPEAAEIIKAMDMIRAEGITAYIAANPDAPLPPAVKTAAETLARNDNQGGVDSIAVAAAAAGADAKGNEPNNPDPVPDANPRYVSPLPAPVDVPSPPAPVDVKAPDVVPTQAPTATADAPSFPPPAKPPTVAEVVQTITPALTQLAVRLEAIKNSDGQTTAESKVAIVTIKQVLAELGKLPPGQPLMAEKAQPLIQKLINEANNTSDPVIKKELEQTVKDIQKQVKDPENLPQRTEPAKKPDGCGKPFCDCNGAEGRKSGDPVTQKDIQNAVEQLKSNPNAKIDEKGNVTITERQADGRLKVTQTTVEKIARSEVEKQITLEAFKKSDHAGISVSDNDFRDGVDAMLAQKAAEAKPDDGLKGTFDDCCKSGTCKGHKQNGPNSGPTRIENAVEARKVSRSMFGGSVPKTF